LEVIQKFHQVINMAPGKRKREDKVLEAFRDAFEKRFQPLEEEDKSASEVPSETSSDTSESWTGFSDVDEDPVVVTAPSLIPKSKPARPELQREKSPETAENIRNDVALQRLLAGTIQPQVNQVNVPMNIRKGIERKRQERKETEAKASKEANIIMARADQKKVAPRRERGVGTPVGRFKGGLLQLSKRDIREIEKPKRKR
jgi:hypothetical protein